MASSVHQSLYEKAMDQLEQIVDADPDFEEQRDADFIEELSESAPGGFTTEQVRRIARLHGKYVGEE
jgi:predicted lipid-binding transport protein (Tim44 family)